MDFHVYIVFTQNTKLRTKLGAQRVPFLTYDQKYMFRHDAQLTPGSALTQASSHQPEMDAQEDSGQKVTAPKGHFGQ